jgi:large subunit ribosomal protein L3
MTQADSKQPKVELRLLGIKRGMVQLFDQDGSVSACTVIQAEPNVITQVKSKESDGYNAVQLGFGEVRVNDARTIDKRVTKPLQGHFKKAGVPNQRYIKESRVKDSAGFTLGDRFGVQQFQGVTYVDVMGVSKGKGYQGVMKKYNFSGGPAAHGSGFHRHAGSTGMRSTPGRCLPGGPRPSHMGDERVTVQGLKVMAIDEENNLILVKGATPGSRGALLVVSQAVKPKVKKQNHKQKKKK